MNTAEIFKDHKLYITCMPTDMPPTSDNSHKLLTHISANLLLIETVFQVGKEPLPCPMTKKSIYCSLVEELTKALIINCSKQFVIK